ncbi:nuclear transport factor 2 family protein [Paracoccus sp. M683]|uniref:nuclear transport factor 2 family protein n=1 Tax=Paracoccus sp. M683 TaxID=2594268 RepID=UPI00118176AC|nr:nuclear transport factor 2 family protein [Paracoccus sp. M683]TRW97271.1 nuclear transport factor 2 family protein [Paracoccus sp. M683]
MSLIRDFWTAMNGNDWAAVADHFLTEDFLGIMPQSAELIRGRADFIRLNSAFPGQKSWLFEVISVVTEADHAASDVRVINHELGIAVRVISFHQLRDDRIARQTEFWPEPYPVPDWRKGMLATDPDLSKF